MHFGPERALETSDIDRFFDSYWNSVKRTRGALCVQLARAPQSASNIDLDKGTNRRVNLSDSRKATFGYFLC
jgi:hypothetical protein